MATFTIPVSDENENWLRSTRSPRRKNDGVVTGNLAKRVYGRYITAMGEPTDSDVLKAVDKAHRARKRAINLAYKRYNEERNNVLRLLGNAPDDVTQAARGTGLRRVEVAYEGAMDRIDAKYEVALDAIRSTAGAWADLVPDFTYSPRR